MIDTVYVLDRTLVNEVGAVTDSHFMGVLSSRTAVERRIDAAYHVGGIANGLYRVIEIILDDSRVTHVYQVKALGVKQQWLRLARNKTQGADDKRITIEELKLFMPEDGRDYMALLDHKAEEVRRQKCKSNREIAILWLLFGLYMLLRHATRTILGV